MRYFTNPYSTPVDPGIVRSISLLRRTYHIVPITISPITTSIDAIIMPAYLNCRTRSIIIVLRLIMKNPRNNTSHQVTPLDLLPPLIRFTNQVGGAGVNLTRGAGQSPEKLPATTTLRGYPTDLICEANQRG